jgi:hypothetical protein
MTTDPDGSSRPTLGDFIQQDGELQSECDACLRCMKERKTLKVRWRAGDCEQHLLKIADLVLRDNSVPRGLVCGVAINKDLMLVIGQTLPKLFGLDRNRLQRWLDTIEWETREREQIPDEAIVHLLAVHNKSTKTETGVRSM